jgi:hypothetical protein
MDTGGRVPARAVIIATGVEYRKLPLENLSRFEGAGVYYGATFVEAQLCGGEEVIVVGGGNSAGQAAVFLAQTASRVHLLVRSGGLAETMSRYLIRRIEETPTIVMRPRTEIVSLEGGDHLELVRWRNNQTGQIEAHTISHVFLMTGAVPNTRWLDGCLALDAKGFIQTACAVSGGSDRRALATHAPSAPPGNQSAGRVCGRRRPGRQCQTCRFGRWRRIDRNLIRPSGSPRIEGEAQAGLPAPSLHPGRGGRAIFLREACSPKCGKFEE